MYRTILLFLAVMLCMTGYSASINELGQVVDYRIVPLPHKIDLQAGEPFKLKSSVKIVYPAGNHDMHRNAVFLATYLKDLTGKSWAITTKSKGPCIELKLGLNHANNEAYQMEVNANRIVISAVTEQGVFYGIQTLRKAIPVGALKVAMPAVLIQDEPRFAYRGMMLDVARHFFTVDEVKTYIDMLVMHNINNFHWHLSDDQGWRIEIKKYPRLTEIGSKRSETVIGKNSGQYDGIPYGGFYTQDQIKEVVDYAKARYINIIPEIDMPGHMLSALSSYPQLGCTGGPYSVWRKWGIAQDVLCAGNDSTLVFIKDVLTELMSLFPSRYIHIGGDECPKTNWSKCPKCQARIQELGLTSDEKHTAEQRLQSYVIQYAEKVLQEHGRNLIGWEEILEGGLAPNATVMSWRGMNGGIEAAKQKHYAIMTPNKFVYFDYYQSADKDKEPLAIGGFVPVQKVYEWDPLSPLLDKEEEKYILGAQANLWTEYIPTFQHAQYMVLPRMAALCEVQWSDSTQKNYPDFLTRIPVMYKMYNLYHYQFAKHLLNQSAEQATLPTNGSKDADSVQTK